MASLQLGLFLLYSSYTKKIIRKIVIYSGVLLILVFIGVYTPPYIHRLLLTTGYIREEINIAGTGSMYPTFPKGEGKTDLVRANEIVAWPKMQQYPAGFKLFGFDLFSYQISRNDIVELENDKTKQITKDKYQEEAGFVKRVIALPSDQIELRDGFVYLNNKILDEPFTAAPRSTYGGDILADCSKITVPEGKVFVMGDNRKASLDSRFELGLVNLSDIHYVLPFTKQEEYKKTWRDTKNDTNLANSPTIDARQFVALLNEKRQEKKLKPLKYNEALTASSAKRGKVMIENNDFSIEASRSGVTLEKAVRDSGYENIVFAEVFTRGFYEAQELLDNFLEFPGTRKILFSTQYQDAGLSAVLGEVNGCPVQVVLAHFGGYVPPNYSKDVVESWSKLVENLENVLPSWEDLKKVSNVDQDKLSRLLVTLNTRLSNAKRIQAKIKADKWLNNEEQQRANEDASLGKEADNIINELLKR